MDEEIRLPEEEEPEEISEPAVKIERLVPAEDANEALRELRELAKAEEEQLDYLPKPPGKIRSGKDHLFLKVFAMMTVLFIGLFGISARLVFGKGWIRRITGGDYHKPGFTLPIAEYPELEEKYYQPDGRYTVEGVYRAVSPSIVTLIAYSEDTGFKTFGQGSGVIMSEDGYIITNCHVVEGGTLSVKVRTSDGTEYSAETVGLDKKSDLAVIKIGGKNLPAAQFGDSDKVTVGEEIVTIGSPAGLDGSITTGIASGLDRMIRVESANIPMSCIQIDAAINPGNSGGALVNMWGQVIGITSSKLNALEYDNIGFAIATKAAMPIIEELIENGSVLGRPRIGITFYEITEDLAEEGGTTGLEIVEIDPDCDIYSTELMIGDIITEIEGQSVSTADDVYAIILKMSPGDEVTAHVVRPLPSGDNEEFDIRFKLEKDEGEWVES